MQTGNSFDGSPQFLDRFYGDRSYGVAAEEEPCTVTWGGPENFQRCALTAGHDVAHRTAEGVPWLPDPLTAAETDTHIGHLRPDHEDCECSELLDHDLYGCSCAGYPLPTATGTKRQEDR